MWVKRKKEIDSNTPRLRDEYERLLNDALSSLSPLQEATDIKHSHRRARLSGAEGKPRTRGKRSSSDASLDDPAQRERSGLMQFKTLSFG